MKINWGLIGEYILRTLILLVLVLLSILAVSCRTAGPQYIMKNCTNCTQDIGESLTEANQGKEVAVPIDAKATALP